MGVVSLPKPFVFRLNVDDPHPIPWIRVKLSAAIGEALYPHPQWQRLGALWESYYPPVGLDPQTQHLLAQLIESMPAFVTLLVNHRPKALRGRSLMEVMDGAARGPLPAMGRQSRGDVSRLAGAGIRRDRPGARRRRHHAGRRERAVVQIADLLGAPRHREHV
jgi:hypothetical protein